MIDVVLLGFKKVFEFLETDFLKEIGSKAFIWGGVGAAIGAAIGWTRGDRIHDVHDLIKHPIDSLQKILGMKPKDPEPDPKAASATKVKAQELELPALKPEKPVDNLSAATTPWQNKVVAEQAQQEEAAVVVGATL